MGTHPIFESDFDCLTDAKQLEWRGCFGSESERHCVGMGRPRGSEWQNVLLQQQNKAESLGKATRADDCRRAAACQMPLEIAQKSRWKSVLLQFDNKSVELGRTSRADQGEKRSGGNRRAKWRRRKRDEPDDDDANDDNAHDAEQNWKGEEKRIQKEN